MGLFSQQVSVNLNDVIRFRERVTSFAQVSYHFGEGLVNSLMEMEAFANQRAEELKKIATSYEQLYSSVKQLEGDISHHISALKTQLSRTPKQLEKKYTGEDGKVKIKKVPNPVYKELETRIQKENSRLSATKDLAWKVYNEVSHSRRVAGELASSASELKSIIPELQSNARDVVSKTEKALYSLENNIRAINNYVTFNFHI